MRSGLLMMNPLKRDFGGSHLPWWSRWRPRWRKCWKEGGNIHPSQSPWCNTVMPFRKKDGSLCFCIDFHKLNVRTKKDSSITPHTRSHWESCRSWVFLLPGPESRLLADSHGWSSVQPSQWATYDFWSANICPSHCVMPLQPSRDWCRII